MLGRSVGSVGIAATCALGASAFIIPSGIAPASDSAAPDLSISLVDPKKQIITLPCSECAFPTSQEKTESAEEQDDSFWIQGGDNSLVLELTVSEDGQQLLLNGGAIYPPRLQQDSWSELQPIYVKQVPSRADLVDIRSGNVRSTELEVTAYGLLEAEKEPLSPNGDVLVPLRFEIIGLENEFFTIDEIAIKLLQTGDDELLIMEVESIPTRHPVFEEEAFPHPGPDRMSEDEESQPHHGPPHHHEKQGDMSKDFPPHHGLPHHQKQECNMLPEPLCKLKAMIENKIDEAMMSHRGGFRKKGGCQGRKGAHGKKLPGHIKPHLNRPGHDDVEEMDRLDHEERPQHHHGPPDLADEMDRQDQEERPKHHHGRPHHMRPHGQHHGQHGHHHFFGHHFLHSFAKGLVAVLIPVMAGITVGMTVSLLGLVVGRLIGFVWIRFARGGRRGYASVAQQEAVVEEGENKPMIAEMEAPPVYENSPEYEVSEKE